ncbi:acyltransferase [Escherichia coli]|nr:acyltransferase [Escherichia coli]HBQ4285342.1 acyltransferase [Escherichia coli]
MIKYRADIDGLRAVAVLAVVIFHAFPGILPGGFIGVDVFFIISGYLISSIIFKNLDGGKFNFTDFYVRRVKRIFPALITMLVFVYCIGWASLYPQEFQQVNKHIIAGAAFVANIVFWSESGYFDTASFSKPLLHLWSLGIEEQFYIFWPLIIVLSWRRKFNILYVSVIICAISFLLNVSKFHTDPSAAYYSPLTRFWEMLLGSILAWMNFKKIKICNIKDHNKKAFSNFISIIGFAFIAIGLIVVSEKVYYPGFYALLPTVGACLLIASGECAIINRYMLSNKYMIYIGVISFPLYLWHWPLLSYARIIHSGDLGVAISLSMIAMSIILASMTYHLIEKPIRFGGVPAFRVASLCLIMIIVSSVAFFTYKKDGLKQREFVSINAPIESGFDGGDTGLTNSGCGIEKPEQQALMPNCFHDKRGAIKYAMIGDSKSASLIYGALRTSTEMGRWLFIGGNGPHGPIVPVISNAEIYKNYKVVSDIAMDAIANNDDIKYVVFVNSTRGLFYLTDDTTIEGLKNSPNFTAAKDGLDKAINYFISKGKKVVLLVDNPTLARPEDCLNRKTTINILNASLADINSKCYISKELHLELSEKYRELLRQLKSEHQDNVFIFDSIPYLCDDGICSHTRNGRFLYSYSDHISDYSASMIGDGLNKYLNALH